MPNDDNLCDRCNFDHLHIFLIWRNIYIYIKSVSTICCLTSIFLLVLLIVRLNEYLNFITLKNVIFY